MSRGARIQGLMQEHNVDAKELAEATGKTVQYIYMILKDKIENPSVEMLNKIARKLGVTIDYLENGTTDKITYAEPEIFNRLPKDLQDFVTSEESTPYIRYAKQLTRYDIAELLKHIDDGDMQFLLTGLQMAIEKQKQQMDDK